MADLKWDAPVRPGWRLCPVVESRRLALDASVHLPTDAELAVVFPTAAFRLQTWGRKKRPDGSTETLNDPHWIAVRGSTPLHWDPRYPRYSHHLKVRVDPGIYVHGLNRQRLELARGVYYVLDAHSPHQVVCTSKATRWNVAVSIDANVVLPAADTIPRLLAYARSARFLP